jgi:signal transduction histidine kinase
MAKTTERRSETSADRARHGRWLSLLPGIERQILLLRWLALLLVLILHWFDRSTAGVLFPVPQMALVMVGYNGLLLLLMRYARWLRRPLNYLAVDTVVATLAVYLSGGYHSSFFVQYVFITIGAAFHLELAPTVIVSLGIGLIYIGACYVNPAGLQLPYASYILAAKLLALLVTAVLCALLLEQLRREHRETERERALAQRLKALNDLFQKLNTTLDLDFTLQTVAEAPKLLLDADLTSIALLDEDGRHLSVVTVGNVDAACLAGQRRSVDDTLVSTILSNDQPYVLDEPGQYLNALPGVLGGQQPTSDVTSIVSVPLLLNGQPFGVLDVAYSKPHTFTDEDLAFLQALGQEAALAIRNARLYEREREQVARLRALDELQEGFVSTVSHELRTPLTCIKTAVDLLRATRAGLSEAQIELVSTIEQHAGRLEALVADLLEITRLEAGQVALARQPTDLRLLVNRVVEALHPLIERKQQTVRLRLPESLSPVDVDRRRIEQVLTNVLSNALKFTPKRGQIKVSVSETPDSVQVCVADDGPGIPPEEQTRVFDKFYVVTDGRGLSGLGLGLYIARQMIELHGGRIWVNSGVGQGSTFCCALPKTAPRRKE